MSELQIRPLDEAEAESVYRQQMQQDFPAGEIKPFGVIRFALRRGEYCCLGLFEQDTLSGYAFLVCLNRTYLLDYFAIAADRRDAGYGSFFMQKLRERYADAAVFLIETEAPDAADDAAEAALRQRRMRFYQRCGCAETGVRAKVFGTEFCILELPCTGANPSGVICTSYEQLYRALAF